VGKSGNTWGLSLVRIEDHFLKIYRLYLFKYYARPLWGLASSHYNVIHIRLILVYCNTQIYRLYCHTRPPAV